MIELIHPIKIYKTKFLGDITHLKSVVIPKLETVFKETKLNNQFSMRYDSLCSYNVIRNLHLWEELQPYVSFLNHHLEIYWKELRYNPQCRPNVIEMWANEYKYGSFIDAHNHSPIAITTSFYLKKSKSNSGNIVFEHPLETLLKHQPINFDDDLYGTLFNKEIEVEEGDVVMFPGWLRHRTTTNLAHTDRIIIGANIMPKLATL